MAKRAKDTEPYRPVQASLVADVMAPSAGVAAEAEPALEAPAPPPVEDRPRPESSPNPVPVVAQLERQPAPVAPAVAMQPFDPRKKLSREKRYLLSVEEEDRIEDLVRSLARELQTPLKLSHLVRAAMSLIVRSQNELQVQARLMGPLARPANGDTPGLLRFEGEVSRLLDIAHRQTKPL